MHILSKNLLFLTVGFFKIFQLVFRIRNNLEKEEKKLDHPLLFALYVGETTQPFMKSCSICHIGMF